MDNYIFQVDFGRMYNLTLARIMQLFDYKRQLKDIALTLDHGKVFPVKVYGSHEPRKPLSVMLLLLFFFMLSDIFLLSYGVYMISGDRNLSSALVIFSCGYHLSFPTGHHLATDIIICRSQLDSSWFSIYL